MRSSGLSCPRCGLWLRLKAPALIVEYCPRCVGRHRRLVPLVPLVPGDDGDDRAAPIARRPEAVAPDPGALASVPPSDDLRGGGDGPVLGTSGARG